MAYKSLLVCTSQCTYTHKPITRPLSILRKFIKIPCHRRHGAYGIRNSKLRQVAHCRVIIASFRVYEVSAEREKKKRGEHMIFLQLSEFGFFAWAMCSSIYPDEPSQFFPAIVGHSDATKVDLITQPVLRSHTLPKGGVSTVGCENSIYMYSVYSVL
jgi:hypothetical protein